jgi:hypothetical protein
MAHPTNQNFCKACGKPLMPNLKKCGWCDTPLELPPRVRRLPDTPQNRARNLKEYKIVGQEDEWLNGGRFDKISMENMLNSYAAQGWIVREMSSSKTFGVFFGTPRDEMMIVLERDMFYQE